MFLEVALPLPLLQTFTYRCPPAVFPQVHPGQRVLVPFRNQRLAGFVVKSSETPPPGLPEEIALKEVLDLIDPSSLISAELLQLSEWVAEYYFASRGEVLRACLPPKAHVETRIAVAIRQPGLEALGLDEETADLLLKERQILCILRDHQSLDLGDLERYAGFEIREKSLRRLVSNQYVQIHHQLAKPAVTARFQRCATLRDGALDAASKLTRRQGDVIRILEASQGPVPVADLLEALSISSSVLNGLHRRGLLAFSNQAVRRDPLKNIAVPTSLSGRAHTSEQVQALKELRCALSSGSFVPALLHGVTGSGKTEIYLCLIEESLRLGRTALMLMPEIGLTPRVAEEFRQRLGRDIAILHSGLSDGERFDEWWRIKRGEARVVIGTRSALFAPVENLGLIVVDEEHDASYKQQESPRYHARDTALVRGKLAKALVVLGSATPAIETFHNARSGKYRFLRLASRVQSRPLPEVTLVDMREEFKAAGKPAVLSGVLQSQVAQRLERKEQVLILLNRRGFSASVLCRSCGQNIQCRNCSISLAFHRAANRLVCHYCSYEQRVPEVCPRCGSEHLYFQGEGTEKVEALLQKFFPNAAIARLDRDTVQRKNAHASILGSFRKGEIDILAGTQMIAKGHDFHNVTLAAVLSADTSLSFPDFRSAERTFHLLSQMSGRPGRGDRPGQVLIQTFHPEHYCLKLVAQHDYEGFFEKEIRFRRMMHYPPFTCLANLLVRDRNVDKAAKLISHMAKIVQNEATGQVRLLGPALSPLAKLKNEHRFQLLIKAKTRRELRELLKRSLVVAEKEGLEASKIHIDIDPQNIM
ncbi:MAG: primosomal protein N' [Acidimicrobiia bacterium]|nr:primosomal protein N' [Acidimicrobiia bacterium]